MIDPPRGEPGDAGRHLTFQAIVATLPAVFRHGDPRRVFATRHPPNACPGRSRRLRSAACPACLFVRPRPCVPIWVDACPKPRVQMPSFQRRRAWQPDLRLRVPNLPPGSPKTLAALPPADPGASLPASIPLLPAGNPGEGFEAATTPLAGTQVGNGFSAAAGPTG